MRRYSVVVLSCVVLSCVACGTENDSSMVQQRSAITSVHLQVTPASDLLDGQDVVVRGTGFEPTMAAMIGQCSSPLVSSLAQCDIFTPWIDDKGAFETTIQVRRSFTSMFGVPISCAAPGSCSLVVLGTGTVATGADAPMIPLTFRNVGPVDPPPTGPRAVTVSPNSNLSDQQHVTLSFSGAWPPWPFEMGICKAGADVGPAGAAGTFSPSQCGETHLYGFYGGLESDQVVRYMLEPGVVGNPLIYCDGPNACEFVIKAVPCAGDGCVFAQPSEIPSTVRVPFTMRAVSAPKRGTAQVNPTTYTAGATTFQTVDVAGAGWGGLSVQMTFCAAAEKPEICPGDLNREAVTVPLDATGGFSRPVFVNVVAPVRTGPVFDFRWVDCTTAPGACVIRIIDPRDIANTKLDIPLTAIALPVPRGTAKIAPSTPLVPGLTVRLEGSGWTANQHLLMGICEGTDVSTCALLGFGQMTDDAGSFRNYIQLPYDIPASCTSASGACSFGVYDPSAPAATLVRTPITFATGATVGVTSHYEARYETLFQQGLAATGYDAASLQLHGGARALWLLAYARASTGAHFSLAGDFAHTTEYSVADYKAWSELASKYDYTVEELQKTGAIFWSWFSTGMPPLP